MVRGQETLQPAAALAEGVYHIKHTSGLYLTAKKFTEPVSLTLEPAIPNAPAQKWTYKIPTAKKGADEPKGTLATPLYENLGIHFNEKKKVAETGGKTHLTIKGEHSDICAGTERLVPEKDAPGTRILTKPFKAGDKPLWKFVKTEAAEKPEKP